MKILIFNWRDIKNPKAGGSEIYLHELAKRWVKAGNQVDWIAGGWKGCKRNEDIGGIKIIRVGGEFSCYIYSALAYFRLKQKPDVIIDVENGIPFFTTLYTPRKKILHIHHIHKEVWAREAAGAGMKANILASFGWILETKFMPLAYKNANIVTLSKSSALEIKKEGFRNIKGIVNPGISLYDYKKIAKNKKPALLFLNRIKKYKGVDILLKAVELLNKQGAKYDVWIAGEGDYLEEAKAYAKEKNLKNVLFFGRINELKKNELMQKAWVFINPSLKEGWGIVNIEANYLGTPVLGSNVGGIKDSVIDGKTGLLFKEGNSKDLADKINMIVKDKKLRLEMSKNSIKWAKNFDWDSKAEQYLKIIKSL